MCICVYVREGGGQEKRGSEGREEGDKHGSIHACGSNFGCVCMRERERESIDDLGDGKGREIEM